MLKKQNDEGKGQPWPPNPPISTPISLPNNSREPHGFIIKQMNPLLASNP